MDVRQPNREQFEPAASVARADKKTKRTFPNGHWLLPFAAGIIVSLIVIVGAFGIYQKEGKTTSDIETDKYQAVFMTNGQVYFGKLADVTHTYADLTDVYYLQVQQAVQPAATDQKSQVSLTKLGSELHGPTDKMHISRDQILFWENLKDDSTVVKAIKEYTTK
jgi:hypothetical protein